MSALVALLIPSLSALAVIPISKDESTQGATPNALDFDPSSCRPISGPNPWALSLASGTATGQSDTITGDNSRQTSPSSQNEDKSTILELNPLALTNSTVPLTVGQQCETIALLDFSSRPQDGRTIRTPSLALTPFSERSYWLSTGLNVGGPRVTIWRRNRGELGWEKQTIHVEKQSTIRLEILAAVDIAFDYSLAPSTQPSKGTIALFRIRMG